MWALQRDPAFFQWWAVCQPFTDPRWGHLWRGLVCGLPPIGRGNEWPDASPLRNGGHLEGFALPDCWVDGKNSRALDYDGIDGRVRVHDAASLDMTNAISIDAWICPHETNGVVLAAKRDAANYAWQLEITADPDNELRFSVNGAGNAATSAVSLPENAWRHVGASYDRKQIRVYVDGKEDGSTAYSAAISTNSVDVTLGSNLTAAPGWYDGLMSTARLWSRKITEGEFSQLHLSAFGMYQLFVSPMYLPNFMGNRAYPIDADMGQQQDGGPVTFNLKTGLPRGGATRPYNANVAGLSRRIDPPVK